MRKATWLVLLGVAGTAMPARAQEGGGGGAAQRRRRPRHLDAGRLRDAALRAAAERLARAARRRAGAGAEARAAARRGGKAAAGGRRPARGAEAADRKSVV